MSDTAAPQTTPPIHGHVSAPFAPVRDALQAAFARGDEQRGCAVAVSVDGEMVVDVWAGSVDRAGAQPFTERTLTPVFSVSKAVTAIVVAKLVNDGKLDYDAPVAKIWPEFAAAGKGEVTLAQALSHQAGVPGFPAEAGMSAQTWLDWDATTEKLAALAPLWPPGTACGYHPMTWGFIAGEVVRRATGATVGAHLMQTFRTPFDIDVWIGLPEAEHTRAATPKKPNAPPDLGELNTATRLAFLERWSSPSGSGVDMAAWRRAEIPAANGHATARGLALLMQPLAREGRLGDQTVIGPDAVRAAMAERIAGPNLVLPYDLSYGAGFIRHTDPPLRRPYGPGAQTVGHTGFGGSCVLADPERRLTMAYVTLTQSPALVEDARAQALIQSVYDVVG